MAAAERAFAAAAHVARVRLVNNRIVVAAMEPRAAVAEYDAASGRFTLHVGCQGVFGLRRALAEDLLRIEPERLRVLAYDIGGSFGMKAAAYPEYVGILHAAQALGRPIKWCDERSGSFISDQQGRATIVEGELALDAEGNFLAVRVRNLADMGAYLTAFGPAMPAVNMQKNLPSLYRTPVVAISTRCVFTNSVPIGPYRGAGRPEANYVMERLVDTAAREMGRDPAGLRRQNLIPTHAMPYRAASGLEYDSGDFAAVLDAGLEQADWAGFAARRDASAAKGRLRGRGLACYLEVTAPPSPEMGGIRFEPDGRVTIVTGTLDYGQGHASAFAQVLVERLGVPFELIDLVQGDSDELLVGGGTGGSRSIMASGKALVEAAAEVIEKGRSLAGHFLEAAAADIEFAAGRFRIAGTDRSIALLDLAARVREATELPPDLPDSLDAALISESPPSAFPNGCHVAEVEIDPETGQVRLDRYTALDDFGTLVNPLLAEGQVHGGVAQGIGQALLERAVYDRAGPAAHRLVHGLRHAARRHGAQDRGRLPSGAGDEQPARRQGLRRGRRHRRAACGDECRARCPGGARRARARHAGDARACLAGLAGVAAQADPQRRCDGRAPSRVRALGAIRLQELASTACRRSRRNCHLTRIERLVNVRPGTARALWSGATIARQAPGQHETPPGGEEPCLTVATHGVLCFEGRSAWV